MTKLSGTAIDIAENENYKLTSKLFNEWSQSKLFVFKKLIDIKQYKFK